jgi:hypothetical protein
MWREFDHRRRALRFLPEAREAAGWRSSPRVADIVARRRGGASRMLPIDLTGRGPVALVARSEPAPGDELAPARRACPFDRPAQLRRSLVGSAAACHFRPPRQFTISGAPRASPCLRTRPGRRAPSRRYRPASRRGSRATRKLHSSPPGATTRARAAGPRRENRCRTDAERHLRRDGAPVADPPRAPASVHPGRAPGHRAPQPRCGEDPRGFRGFALEPQGGTVGPDHLHARISRADVGPRAPSDPGAAPRGRREFRRSGAAAAKRLWHQVAPRDAPRERDPRQPREP